MARAERLCGSSTAAQQALADNCSSQKYHQGVIRTIFAFPCRSSVATSSIAPLLDALDKLDTILCAFVGCRDVDGVHNACRLIWNAALPLLGQEHRKKQLKQALTSAVQALASVASPLHRLRCSPLYMPSLPCGIFILLLLIDIIIGCLQRSDVCYSVLAIQLMDAPFEHECLLQKAVCGCSSYISLSCWSTTNVYKESISVCAFF